ncbi:MAG: hypothetical protein JNL60_12390 [Bacteroidia bacterium]|nr:hypothetical protein [Bacteroidia bacterium]
MFRYLKYLLIFFVIGLEAQDNLLCRVSPDGNVVQVKWYCAELLSKEGVNIYRREIGEITWQKLNQAPVKHGSYSVSQEAKLIDKELSSYITIAADPKNLKDLAFLACIIKSFKSDEFSKFLGIRFDDVNFIKGKEYEYKLTRIKQGIEADVAISSKIVASGYKPIEPQKEISFTTGKKKVSFLWKPESSRYFGTDIYRRIGDTGTFVKITKDPIILSKTKTKDGKEEYGKEFFVDSKLRGGVKYYYQFLAIDFFGDVSEKSETIEVYIKDLEAPIAPDSVYKTQQGRRVSLRWKKKNIEDDLAGFNVYRTTKNDTDYVRINKELVSVGDSVFIDSVPHFGSYMYAISAVDYDKNESRSNPFFLEIYDDEPPVKPKNLTISADTGVLRLSWEKNPEDDLEGYLIYRTINENSADNYVKITPVPVTTNSYEERLPSNTKNKFLYKIVAVDQSLNKSPYSDFAAASMPDVKAPNAPFLKTLAANEKEQIQVEWLLNAEPDLAGYNVFRRNMTDSVENFEKVNTRLIPFDSYRYIDRTANLETVYEYYLVALDSTGNISKSSNKQKIKIRKRQDDLVEIKRFEAKYDKRNQQISLKWMLDEESELKGIILYKRNSNDNYFFPLTGVLQDNVYKDKDVSSGNNYIYQLRVYNKRGDVFKSDQLEIRTGKPQTK